MTFKSVLANWKSFQREVEAASAPALEDAAQVIFDRSQELVPVATGRLKASGKIESKKTSNGAVATISYGEGGPDYAVNVHEDLQVFHDDGQAKFLEHAVFENMKMMPEEYGRALKRKTRLR